MQKYIKVAGEWIQVIVMSFVIFFLIHTYVAEAREIPTGSMIPNIKVGERVWVDKIYYKLSLLERKDIIVFKRPGLPDDEIPYIKRIIGLPGETLEIRDGHVLIDGKELEEDYLKEPFHSDYGPIVVPNNSFFVMGDNRNNSLDSRSWGFVPQENILGHALLRFYPLSRIGMLPN